MEHGKWYVGFGIALVVLCLLGAAYFLRSERIHPSAAATPVVTPTPTRAINSSGNLTGLSIYTDGANGFSVFYPAGDTLTEGFSSTSRLPTSWRLGASASGTPIVSLTDSDTNALVALVRIGASSNKQEVKSCLRASPGETKLTDAHLGGTLFKRFSFDRTGTDTEVTMTSYRAVHDGACVAIESFLSSSIATSTDLAGIVQSFSFARP